MKTTSIPVENFVKSGNTLVDWMGYFWTRIYENADLVKNVQQGQGVLLAQLYLNFMESVSLINRNEVPVFHRERWTPLVIRLSQAGTGTATLIKAGMDPTPVVGPQTGSEFIPGEVFPVGGNAEYAASVSYPLSVEIADVVTCIADNIMAPKVVLIRDQDFIVEDNTIIFMKQNDPFKLSAFPQRAVGDDMEILLWACDTLVDKEYIYKYLSFVLGIQATSTEYFRQMVNALWNLYNYGTPIGVFKSAVGAILGEPTIVHTTETVQTIISGADYAQVVTDKEVYNVSKTAVLRDACVVGAVLQMGEFLTETVRLYETLDPMKLAAVSEFGERFRDDVRSLFFEKALLRSPLQFGIGVGYDESDIVIAGLDSQGNPRMKFTLYGDPDDITLFWRDFWQYLEDHNITSETCFQEYLNDIVLPVDGTVVGHVPPLEYFLRYFMRANAMVLVVDRDKLAVPPEDVDPIGQLQLLRPALPAHVMLITVEHRYPEIQEYDLDTLGSGIEQMQALAVTSSAMPGGPSTATLTYKDRPPVIRWIAQCGS